MHETLTGLGATGVEMVIAYVANQPRQGHPLVPMIQIGNGPDVDLTADGDLIEKILSLIPRVLGAEYRPKAFQLGNVDFQVTRGLLGVSL